MSWTKKRQGPKIPKSGDALPTSRHVMVIDAPWCNVEVEDTLVHSLNDDSLIDCLPDEAIDELNEVHANRWMETLYEPSTPCATPDMADIYMQLGFDPPA